MMRLDARNQQIADAYSAGGVTYEQLGQRFDITRERVRQICIREKALRDAADSAPRLAALAAYAQLDAAARRRKTADWFRGFGGDAFATFAAELAETARRREVDNRPRPSVMWPSPDWAEPGNVEAAIATRRCERSDGLCVDAGDYVVGHIAAVLVAAGWAAAVAPPARP